MAVTFTAAAERDIRVQRGRAGRFGRGDLVLAAVSCVIVLMIGLAYVGRFAAMDRSDRDRVAAAIDLGAVESADALEPGLAAVLPDAGRRRAVAREWFERLKAERESGRGLANVASAVRLAGSAEPLFTASQLAAMKPSFIVRTPAAFRDRLLLWSILYLAGFHLLSLVWRWRRIDGDRLLLAAAHLMTGIGLVLLVSRPDPLRDALLFPRYAEGVLAGLILLLALSTIDFGKTAIREFSYVPMLCAIVLCALLIAFGDGPGRSGAKVNLGPVQPIEAIRLLLALFLAGYLSRRWELLRGVRSRTIRGVRLPDWVNLPRGEYVLPVLAGVAAALLLFAAQRDLGPALLLCCVFLMLYGVARGRVAMPVIGFALLLAGFFLGHVLHISRALSERILMWQAPWDNAASGGDQVAQAIWAMASGGFIGSGVGLGDSRYLPAGHTDLILAAAGEELGIIGILVLAATYAIIAARGFRIARSAGTDYGFFLATALTLFLIVPVLVMAAGIVGAIPLTGVVTPFLSYGGSAMAANFAALGILASIGRERRPATDRQPFDIPFRWMKGTLAVAAVVLLALVLDIQVVRADSFVVRPHLGLQGDGGRRYAYNPRVLDVARQMVRGSVFDRRGLPLATGDPAVVERSRAAYAKLGVSLAEVCPSAAERCYPLGGRAFHLLGDARTRANWSAGNSSYIERDDEAALRGFDDRAEVVATTDAAGRSMSTIRRDYRDLLPLVRHRYEPDHPDVAALRQRTHDIRLTIDAALQIRVAAIVEAHAKNTTGRAAAVVLDPDSGAVLASVSYPWPSTAVDGSADEGESDALLDRARYGLYPPGSTFKLVTAAAALSRDSSLASTTFSCVRLPDGRSGAKLPGWTRPVRDDVLDSHPHGSIDLHEAVIHSCNAYFAQLAVKLGPQPLIECAGRLGIALTPSAAPTVRVRDTLPQVGYGQADVRATPLRMARLAAGIAASGVIQDARWKQNTVPAGHPFLPAPAARMLAADMRAVVTRGTGSSLRNHPWRIAGKTGTAEVDGAASHGWFVGFAPYGAATQRIAFAIVLEHAGYGGRTAAPVAGEIVTAAGELGLMR